MKRFFVALLILFTYSSCEKDDACQLNKENAIKILAVGNSWTVNATKYVGDILADLGLYVEIGVSYSGGKSLEYYWQSIEENREDFEFHRYVDCQWSRPSNLHSYESILESDQWDIITHQQVSTYSGVYSTFQPYLHNIIEWEKSKIDNNYTLFLHATWAYPNNYDYSQFISLYGANSNTMYEDIITCHNQALIDENIKYVMPSTPMIQQVRELGILGIDKSGEVSHLSTNGEFAAACIWVEMLLRNYYDPLVSENISITDSNFKPRTISYAEATKVRELAKNIVVHYDDYFVIDKNN